jgi:hypothetical protein
LDLHGRIENKVFCSKLFWTPTKTIWIKPKNQISHEMRKHNQFVAQLCKMESGKWEYEEFF